MLANIWSDSGSFPVAHTSLSQDGFQREGFWEVGGTYHLLPHPFGPSLFLLVRLRGSTAFFIRTSCGCPRKHHHAWPRQVVSVMGSPTSISFRHHFFLSKDSSSTLCSVEQEAFKTLWRKSLSYKLGREAVYYILV